LEERILNKRLIDESQEGVKKTKVLFHSIAFYVNDNIYAMDVMNITEIIIPQKIYKVPNTSNILLGVLNLRGNILPIYSLKLILGMDDPYKGSDFINDEERFIIMIRKNKDIFGFMIDSIYKNIQATDENYRSGEYLQKWSKNFLFNGVILENDNEILVLNVDSLLKYIINKK